MKHLTYFVFLIPILSYAGEEKSLSDLIDANHINDNNLIEAEDLSTDKLLNTGDITLLNDVGDEGEYEIRVDVLESELFEDEAREDAENNSCKKGGTEKVVCANIMCDFGLILGEWSSECTDYKLKLAEAIATTPPWESLPSCILVDKSCKESGKAEKANADEDYCNKMADLSERHQCLMALDLTNKKGATEFIVRNGGNSDDVNGISFLDSDPEEIGTDFLVNSVDPRFNFEEELTENYTDRYRKCNSLGFNCGWRDRDTGIQPMTELNFFLEHRDDPAYASEVQEKRDILVSRGTMLEQCENVSFSEFFNCNFYPDLPQQCWTAPNHEAIAECVDSQEIASNL